MSAKPTKRVKGSVGEGEAGKKTKTTQHAGGQSVSEKSQPYTGGTQEQRSTNVEALNHVVTRGERTHTYHLHTFHCH